MSQTLGIATNKKIIEIFDDYRSKKLVLKPRFQRNLVWNSTHKEAFIETILKNLPFPEVYFADGPIDLESQTSTIIVVDGQQRLNTIFEYINNSSDLKFSKIINFSKLSKEEQTSFFDYIVVVRSLGRLSEEAIIDIFRRINSVQYALNAIEVNNALYEGAFISTAKDIASSDLFKEMEILSEEENARMKDVEYVLLVMATLETGQYFTETNELENLITTYDDYYDNSDKIKNSILHTCEIINRLNLETDSMWYRKSAMFSLICELSKIFIQKKEIKLDHIKLVLNELEETIMNSKKKDPNIDEYAKFYKFMFQQTTSRIGRYARGNVINNHLSKYII